MTITEIVNKVNQELAGELLTYNELKPFMDRVIDDINDTLDTTFPTFTEFTSENFPDKYPNYDFFPEKHIRGVVIKGTAYKFYIMDEEGIQTANQYGYDYQYALFIMLRDYLEDVPNEYKARHKASVHRLTDVAFIPPWFGDPRL